MRPQNAMTYDEVASLLIKMRQMDYFKPGGWLDAFIENLTAQGLFSGAVGVGFGNEILFEGGNGYAENYI
jgi:hypothetical protein